MLNKIFPSILAASAFVASVTAFTGDVTWGIPASVQTCTFLTPAHELVALLSASDLGTGGANCLKTVSAVVNGKNAVATVVGVCPTCDPGSIDLSPAAFVQLAELSIGRIHGVQWDFL